MMDIDVEDIPQYETICSEVDSAYVKATLFILRSEGDIFVGYGRENEIDKVMSIDRFSKVEDAGNYSGYMQSYCDYCNTFDKNQLPGTTERPSLSACHICHDHIKNKLEQMIKDNCPEVMANHF